MIALVGEGAIDGLSIGYRTVRGRIDPKTRVRRLHQVDLWDLHRHLPAARWRAGAGGESAQRSPRARPHAMEVRR